MAKTRVEIVQETFLNWLASAPAPTVRLDDDEPLGPHTTLTARRAREIFADQLASRLLDVAAREMRKTNQSFYTISSAGHENNAVLGALLRLDDPCFLHYRSGGLMLARSRQAGDVDGILDTVRSFCASADDPISGGRHKVWGSKPLWVPPQTSTIASHLPKAYGMAYALRRAHRLGLDNGVGADAVVLCSFGDASANHATALAGINSARYAVRRGGEAPVVFLCEDNGIGISVETPSNWIHDNFSALPHLHYVELDGTMDAIWDRAAEAVAHCRRTRKPVFLHLHTVRLWGHAGTDAEISYRSVAEIEAIEARDPLLANARRLVATGAAAPDELRELVRTTQARIEAAAAAVVRAPKLTSVAEIVRPLAPYDEVAIRAVAREQAAPEVRREHFGTLPEKETAPLKRTLCAHVNAALADEMLRFPEISVFGEDVGRKGGVYGATQGLQKAFGPHRCFDTLLDETTILGTAQGAAMAGLLPIPEIQYLAYLHNALDQLRGEACSLQYFSNGQFANPMVVRVQGLAYQKGFGGHFHNDNSIGALRDIPGLLVGVPARGDDAAMMLRGLVATARACGRVAVFIEPIALYHERDLHAEGDGAWLFDYPTPERMLLPGEVGVYHPKAKDLLIVTYGNGVRLSLRAAKLLAEKNISARVLDLRWLNPLPLDAIRKHAAACGRVLVADECRATAGGIADAVIAALAESGFAGPLASVRAVDTYVPLAAAANLVLISDRQIAAAAEKLAGR
ncbi:thiamine pyrophosphate-dependent enzyme [Oleiharenicola sp. Vm1]|uniref:thiamine pyrophosphate-dependent enzyme n=1 Tax=Oleiharenicola sp. Vm1 TaxID=3398393 RepID=UPI0039F5C2FF